MKGDLCFLGPDPGLTCKLALQWGPLWCACEWAPSCWGLKFLPVCVLSHFSCVQLFSTLWTVARQDPLSMGFSRQEYLGGLPCPPPGHLPDLGIKPLPLMSPALADGFFMTSTTWEAPQSSSYINNVCLVGNFIFICMVCILNE